MDAVRKKFIESDKGQTTNLMSSSNESSGSFRLKELEIPITDAFVVASSVESAFFLHLVSLRSTLPLKTKNKV